ncbi:fused MFS/spermidine synthase [Corynebacterium imitans]|uniref:spermidine synthase n=1 Tax=Corynebacterium imitans TaxID=156978 RepID=UPI001EF2D0A8|nr:fused MFS/spermidine synthase [Corynebacterium imitans]
MSRGKPRAPKRRIEGDYPIATGTAAIVADPARDGGFTLEVNRVPSSYVVLGAPEVLHYDYMRWFAEILASHTLPESFSAVHLGAGACSFASYVQHRYPDSANVAVELDRELAKLVRWAFDPPVKLKVAEARAFTHALAPGSQDLIVRDVFAGPATPRALTTVEFYTAVRRALRPGGLFLANIGDTKGLPTTRAELAGLREVFGHTVVLAEGNGYGNVVVGASTSRLEVPGALALDAHEHTPRRD